MVTLTGFSCALGVIAVGAGSAARASAQLPAFEEEPVPRIELGEEYLEYAQGRTGRHSPEAEEPSTFSRVMFYLPNRLLDLLDIFRMDIGAGPAFGAVVRVTKYGQVGYRTMSPASLRVGLCGRRAPLFVEHSSEFGVGPFYVDSADRRVTPVEIGAGADLFVVGGYFGVSLDEAVDFFGGIVGFDFKGDDLD